MAQFQRTINPAFRSSSPQPSMFESHHDPGSDLATRMGHAESHISANNENMTTPRKTLNKGPLPPGPSLDGRNQVPHQAKVEDVPMIPHNEYPTDGMTMLCRTDLSSDISSAASPYRPSSRESQSDYSNPTSFSSQDPASKPHSPIKENPAQVSQSMSPTKAVQKKRSGFFSNSPFRRKSKHEKEAPAIMTPTARNTWKNGAGGAGSKTTPSNFYDQSRSHRDGASGSPEPADPRASFQLNVGNNVFDVASPDKKSSMPPLKGIASSKKTLDPIAAALEELKGVNKQSSVRMSADRYAGVSTPGPGSQASTQGTEPPPSYNEPPTSRLGAPQPAFTSAQMRQTTQKYVSKNQDMYGTSRRSPRSKGADIPRATSPRPMRSTSPRPSYHGQDNNVPRSASPNPYSGSRNRPPPNASPEKSRYSRHTSPQAIAGNPSPQQQVGRQQERPHSSGNMAMQLSDGAPRGRGSNTARPMSYYGGPPPQQQGPDPQSSRPRAKSVADGRKFTANGKPILQFGKFKSPLGFSHQGSKIFRVPFD